LRRQFGTRLPHICCVPKNEAFPVDPSQEDINLAYDPDISYVIISLEGGKEDIRSFSIKNSEVKSVVQINLLRNSCGKD